MKPRLARRWPRCHAAKCKFLFQILIFLFLSQFWTLLKYLEAPWFYTQSISSKLGQSFPDKSSAVSLFLQRFVTSKLWNTHHAIGNVKKGCQQTLKDLGTSFLDLYLIHWPVHFKYEGLDVLTPKNSDGTVAIDTSVNIVDTWKEMEKLVDEGLVKDIGVSNFTIAHLETILKSCRIKPAVNQVELHPYLPQQALLDFCTKNGIHMTAYSPLGSGKEGGPLSNETIAKIAQAHSATPAQILLSWAIQRGTSVIPKSVNPSRIAENFKTITLSESDMKEIAKLGEKKKRFIDPYAFWNIDIFGEK